VTDFQGLLQVGSRGEMMIRDRKLRKKREVRRRSISRIPGNCDFSCWRE